MSYQFLSCLVPAIIFSCSGSEKADAVISTNDAILTIPADTAKTKADPFADSLRLYFENPCDFYALKKNTEHMHSGGRIDLADKYFHTINNPDAVLYHYWAIEFRPPRYAEYSLCFATWKPWKTAVQKYYETDNETLVGIHCKVEWDGLGNSNFVGMHIDSVKAKFGKPQATDDRYSIYWGTRAPDESKDKVNTTIIYYQNDHLLVLHEENYHIVWFKYYWWHENIISIDAIPDHVFRW
jgi:hypothetical protein